MMPAIIVSISARTSISCASPRTSAVKLIAAPVCVMTPMMMPAHAQASATAIEFFAPSSSAPQMVLQPMPACAWTCAQERHRHAGERACERAQRRAVAHEEADQDHQDGE
jgi:hypothetical protein